MNTPVTITFQLDFKLLKQQKKTLIRLIDDLDNKKGASQFKTVKHLNGILGLIDSIQDYVVDNELLMEKEVFNTTTILAHGD